MAVPKDPVILLSYINTQLRDSYENLDELCTALGIEKGELERKLAGVDYRYDEGRNQFI